MTRFHVIVASSFLIVGILLVAGCPGSDYVPNHDIVLIKVTPNGTLVWSKIFDSGKDDTALSFFQTSDGGYAMLGSIEDKHHFMWYHNNLVKFSDTGDEQWNRTLYQLNCSEEFLIQDRDGLLLTYTSTGSGGTCKFNLQGDLVWKGTSMIIGNELKNTSETLDEKVNITKIQTFVGPTVHCFPTLDTGFFCAELQSDGGGKSFNLFEGEKTTLIAKKLDNDGILIWERPLSTFCKPKNKSNIELTNIIQTTDGGYVILGSRDNFFKC